VLAALPARVVACRGLDQVDDGLPGLRAQLKDGAELGAADNGIPDQGQELDLLLQQAGLFVVVVEEESRRDAKRKNRRSGVSRFCGHAVRNENDGDAAVGLVTSGFVSRAASADDLSAGQGSNAECIQPAPPSRAVRIVSVNSAAAHC